MPNLTGVKLVEEVRKRGITSNIIVVAANLSPEVREAFSQMGVHAMFMKPFFNVDELRSAVDGLVVLASDSLCPIASPRRVRPTADARTRLALRSTDSTI